MDKEFLHQVLEFLKEKDLKVGILVTDRHLQITKWMREQHPNVKHYFDVWHVAHMHSSLVRICYLMWVKLQ